MMSNSKYADSVKEREMWFDDLRCRARADGRKSIPTIIEDIEDNWQCEWNQFRREGVHLLPDYEERLKLILESQYYLGVIEALLAERDRLESQAGK